MGYSNKLHHTFTLVGAILIGISFLSNKKIMWILLGVGVACIMVGVITHAVRHHKRKQEDNCALPTTNDPVYVTPIQQSTTTYSYQYPSHYPVPNHQPLYPTSYGAAPYTPYNPYSTPE